MPDSHEIILEVTAAGVNRADLSQRKGNYAPPEGAPSWPGLECSGVVAEVGSAVTRWKVGDRVCALVAGGAYASLVAVHETQVIAVPEKWPLIQAAAFLEAAATAWSNIIHAGSLRATETLLVHGGSSGVGSMAIQIGKQLGATVIATVGTEQKAQFCRELGADETILYRDEQVTQRVLDITHGRGVDVILDLVGGSTITDNIARLATDGRLVIIGVQGGNEAQIDLKQLLLKRGIITGSMLRRRSLQEKAILLSELERSVVPAVLDGHIRIPIDSVYSFDEAMQAHEKMEASQHCGKIVLTP